MPVARFSIKYILSGVLESFYYRIGFSKKCVVRVISPEISFIAQSDVIFFQRKENLLKRKKKEKIHNWILNEEQKNINDIWLLHMQNSIKIRT